MQRTHLSTLYSQFVVNTINLLLNSNLNFLLTCKQIQNTKIIKTNDQTFCNYLFQQICNENE